MKTFERELILTVIDKLGIAAVMLVAGIFLIASSASSVPKRRAQKGVNR